MPDILIRGMEMPTKGYKTIILHSNGRVYEPTSEELIVNKIADATELPPHGDLVDTTQYRDEFMEGVYNMCADDSDNNRANVIIDLYDCAPVVVPEERRE